MLISCTGLGLLRAQPYNACMEALFLASHDLPLLLRDAPYISAPALAAVLVTAPPPQCPARCLLQGHTAFLMLRGMPQHYR